MIRDPVLWDPLTCATGIRLHPSCLVSFVTLWACTSKTKCKLSLIQTGMCHVMQ